MDAKHLKLHAFVIVIAAMGQGAVPGFAATPDEFKAACMAVGEVPEASCTCQADLTKDLKPVESDAVVAGMSGKRQDYIAAINKMSADEAKAFREKMDALSFKAQSTCNAPK